MKNKLFILGIAATLVACNQENYTNAVIVV